MLGLKLPSDPRWVYIAEKNIEEILTDHAYCEQKAASYAISLIIGFPEKKDLVLAMIDLAQEEMSHFKMVHEIILKKGYKLGRERKDEYVLKLNAFFPKGGSRTDHLVNKLLCAALIEARSCERFRILSEKLNDQDLKNFYRKLMISEAHHYTLFLKLARKYSDEKEKVDDKWKSLLEFESELIKKLGNKEFIHG